jgi:hypothetical protein
MRMVNLNPVTGMWTENPRIASARYIFDVLITRALNHYISLI